MSNAIDASGIELEGPQAQIHTRRNGSAASLVKKDGVLTVERRDSNGTDLMVAIQRRISESSLPSVIPIPALKTDLPFRKAEDVLAQQGGVGAGGAYKEHMFPLDLISSTFQTHIDPDDPSKSLGLSSSQAEQILAKFGPNVLTPPPKVPLWIVFLLQFTNLLMVLLMITGALCIVLFIVNTSVLVNLYLGLLLFVVVFVTCYETFSAEAKSDQLMEKFRNLVPASATLIRDGQLRSVSATEIVVGDLIRLKSGDKIPADCRIIYNQSLKVDQAMLTGESEAVESTVDAADPNALEARNIIFNGSLVVDGSCIACAIRTGDATLIGTMVEMTSDVGKSSSTLKADIEYFVKVLTIFALLQSALVFIVGLIRGLNPFDLFIYGFITMMIGNVPQGLPTTVTACLFIVAERMGRENVFVKKLDIIETLGSCNCICTDKTGTLTQNLMSVANTWVFASSLSDKKFVEMNVEEKVGNVSSSQLQSLMEIAILNSRVALEKNTDTGDYVPNGDATELGLYRFFGKCIFDRTGIDIEEYRQQNQKLHEIPFNSSNKWQMSIHRVGKTQRLFLKGAPDVLLGKCNRYLTKDGKFAPIDDHFVRIYTSVYEDFGGNGERVLGFAMKPMERSLQEEENRNPNFKDELKEGLIGQKANPIRDLIFVGLVTLMDPPREEVPQAIIDCRTAGVRVVMVTGDHPITAAAIARKIGLITLPTREVLSKERKVPKEQIPEEDIHAVVVHGQDIPKMNENDWKVLLSKKEIVFARTSPEQKLVIVQEFTKAGCITAMTGDGVNDSPALKQAAIGVAMGKNGSDVAREAADLVLLDDNFASIVVGIKEGRLLFSNLKKSIAYTLCHLTPEVIPVLLWAFVGIPQPMGSMLTLCIDLLTELAPATSLAFEKPESNIMQVPPRDPKKDKLTSFPLLFYAYFLSGILEFGCCLFIYFRGFERYGVSGHDLFANNNKYFPSANNDNFVTSSGTVYSPHDQNHILYVIQGAWYLQIVCCQATHLMFARTTTVSIFQHGFFCNMKSNIGIFIAICLGCFVVYTPGVEYVVSSAHPFSVDIFEATLISAFLFLVTTEARKWYSRTYPLSWWNQKIFGW